MEIIQVKTERYGFETLCEVNQENAFVKMNGYTQKCNDILSALQMRYPKDEFRVLVED